METFAGEDSLTGVTARATQGDPEALNALANAYATGAGVSQNYADALRLYRQAADRGLPAAQFNLGLLYELGWGVAPDTAAAFKHYRQAAEQGFAPAQFNVGNMYARGIGIPPDEFEALLWFLQAAVRGLAEAQYNVALAYENGRGAGRDESTAQRWYGAAAAQGHAQAQFNLGLMLEQGRGSAADPTAAATFYRAAAVQNSAPAQNNLGRLLAEGRGVPADVVEAYKWLALAVENGAEPTARNQVAGRLTASELDVANASLARARALVAERSPALADSGQPGQTAGASGPSLPIFPAPVIPLSTLPPSPSLPPELPASGIKSAPGSTQTLTLETERKSPGRELGLLESTVRPSLAASSTENKQIAVRTSSVPLPQLAAGDPRIASLLRENTRLNEDILRANLRLVQVTRQLKAFEEKDRSAAKTAPAVTAAPNRDQVAELVRRSEILRQTVAKLAEENRWYYAMAAEHKRLQAENERLKAERVTGPFSEKAPAPSASASYSSK